MSAVGIICTIVLVGIATKFVVVPKLAEFQPVESIAVGVALPAPVVIFAASKIFIALLVPLNGEDKLPTPHVLAMVPDVVPVSWTWLQE